MTIAAADLLPVRSIRESFNPGFAAWDRSVEHGDQAGAKAARRQMRAAAFALLPRAVANFPGWYFFVDLSPGADINGVHYVGVSKTERRPIGRRIVDRFRDDSCPDTKLDGRTEAEQRCIVERRLLCALPQSGGNYIDKHLKVSALIRRSTHILMVGTRDTPRTIEEVERLLIGSAAESGAPLMNARHRSFRGGVSAADGNRAREVLDCLGLMGLAESALDPWRLQLSACLGRVNGRR